MEPPHTYVRDASAAVVHHDDYLDKRDGHALCGVLIAQPVRLDGAGQPTEVCPGCEAKLVEYHLNWWRDLAQSALAELDELRRTAPGPVHRDTASEPPAAEVAPDLGSDDAEPTTLLEHARRELLTLCREFDGAVPYRRVKITMQSFSDNLTSEERALLAQQIGNDGSLLRWSTIEVETRGWHVTDNPVQEESEAMWEAWTRDAYQTPKASSKRWLGRSRSRGSG